jgi:hypothetical protein
MPVHLIFLVFQANQPDLLGASIFSPDEIHSKLKKLKASLPRDPSGLLFVTSKF